MPYPEEVEAAAIAAAAEMGRLDPGAMAALRRMTAESPAPAFWKIAVRHPVMTQPDRLAAWVEILRILAILTPRGAPENRPKPLHRSGWKHRLGAALCDGGDPAWPGADGGRPLRPVMSERRLAQLLATRGGARTQALVRAARRIAANRDPQAGLDVRSIAWAVLAPDKTNPIAEAYYRRLDQVSGQTEETTA